jgi:autotransporter-associated beta strand protein
VTLSQTTNGTYAGPMTGTGSLRKSGAGDVTLTGANTYSGGTEVAAGRLIGDTRSLQGAITNNAATTFSQTTNGTYAGAMTGTGSLLKAGAGTVTLGGANSYSGGTEVAAGRLVGTTASLQGAITNNAAVTFDQATNGTYSGEMSGSGALTKSGSGAVTVTGDNSYAGGTTVNAGSLVATTDTALGSGDVAINEGSVLATDGVTLSNDFTIGSTATAVTNSFTVSYNFGTTSGTASPSSSDAVGFTIGDVSQGNNNGTTTLLTTTSASSGYAGASGQYNAGAAAFTGALNTGTSTYFEFNLTRTAATSVTLADVTFGSRSTSTAPQAYSIRETGDLATSLASDTMANNSVWALENAAFTDTLIASGGGTTFRIYGYNGTGSPTVGTANWRIDDLTLTGESVTGGAGGGSGTLGIEEEGTASFTGGITINTTATFTAATDATAIFSGIVSGPGTDLAKTGGGTVTLSGSSANTFAGTTTVEEGTLRLNKTAGTTAIEGDLEVATGATLLISASNQVANTSEVTLSGGTIARGGGVSEVFGDLNLTADSFIDFGTGAIGSLQFGTYSPTELLTVSNFLIGNTLIFGSDLTSTINNASFFSFDNGFTTDYSGGLFTITAIPEPSTYVAAAGLLALMAWPVRRRLVRDVKSILGLRAPMRDRLARKA